MGKVIAVCTSEKRGTQKKNVGQALFLENYGIEGDAHAGNWHRQVSLLCYEKIEAFRQKGAQVSDGAFGENLVVEGIDFKHLPVGTLLKCGEVVLEVTQIGKECHSHCEIYQRMGECIMPKEGVFARVVHGGKICVGDEMEISYRVAVITASDKGFRGEREDLSGPAACKYLEQAGWSVVLQKILPDEREVLSGEMRKICDEGKADLILTTGGTGFSPRDITPEATADILERAVPGIPEAIRAYSMQITGRAMLSRAIAGIRKKTLIINLPGSPKAVAESLEYILPHLSHGIGILTGVQAECARR